MVTKFELFYRRIMEAAGVSTDTELAKSLGINKSTLAMWKKRMKVNYEILFTKFEQEDYNWLFKGEGTRRNTENFKCAKNVTQEKGNKKGNTIGGNSNVQNNAHMENFKCAKNLPKKKGKEKGKEIGGNSNVQNNVHMEIIRILEDENIFLRDLVTSQEDSIKNLLKLLIEQRMLDQDTLKAELEAESKKIKDLESQKERIRKT